MSPSSPAVAKICFNSQCKEPLQDPPPARRKGWRLRSGEIAELCDRCSCTFEQGNFCETYHSDDEGWRNCEACGKRVHCGCIVSITAYAFLDADGVDCAACATKPSATVSREKEDLPKKDVSPRNKCKGRKVTLTPSPTRRATPLETPSLPPSSAQEEPVREEAQSSRTSLVRPSTDSTSGASPTQEALSRPSDFPEPTLFASPHAKTSATTANSPDPSPITFTIPSAPDKVDSTATSSPDVPILSEVRLADAWADARNQVIELSSLIALGNKYSYKQIKHWAMSMSVAQFQETQRPAKVELEKESKLKTALDIFKAKLQFEMTIRANMEMELDEQIAKSSQLFATKESELAAQRAELRSLRSDATTIVTELMAAQAELATYRAKQDECFETWKKDLFKTREFNVLIGRCITVSLLLGSKGGMKQLKEGGYLKSDTPANCLDLKRIISSYPSDEFHNFI